MIKASKVILLSLPPLLMAMLLSVNAGAMPEAIAPMRAEVSFSRASSSGLWGGFVNSASGAPAYFLTLEPEYAAGNHLSGLSLVLRDARSGSDTNLLNPSGIWHGMQPYSFMALDLSRGPADSAYGAHRTIVVKDLGIVIHVDVLEAETSFEAQDGAGPIRLGIRELDELRLVLSVDNLRE